MSSGKQTVFLTGITGYAAQHIAQQLLDSKRFKVLGSYRNKSKAKELVKNFNNNEDLSLVLIEDIGQKNAFDKTFAKYNNEIDYIIHAAAPYDWNVEDPQSGFITPGVNGSKGIFNAAFEQLPNLKHFIITSSFAAMLDSSAMNDTTHVFDEESWNPITLKEGLSSNRLAYRYSKTRAEKIMWNLVKELSSKFAVTAVVPNLILGPQCFESNVTPKLNTSCEYVNKYIKSKPGDKVAETPAAGGVIDVRDLARAHVDTLLYSKKFDGQRLFLTNEPYGDQIFVDILNGIPQLKGKITEGIPHRDDDISKKKAKLVNDKTRKLLDFKFISLEKSIRDMALQILEVQNKQIK